jgi:hypothetical protein
VPELVPPRVDGPGQDGAEERPDLRAGEEVAVASRTAARAVEPGVLVVEDEVEVVLEGDGPDAVDPLEDGG